MKFDKKILGLVDIASKERLRMSLSSIRFENGKAIATDGFMLMVIQQPDINDQDIPKVAGFSYVEADNVHIPAYTINKIAKDIARRNKKNKFLPILRSAWSVRLADGNITIATTDLENTSLKEVKMQEEEYPKYQKIIDGEMSNSPVIQISFDLDKMLVLLTAMKKSGANQPGGVTLRISGELNPIIITGKDESQKEVMALLMPIRRS